MLDQKPKYPRLSLGLPVYNGEAFLEETINSILKQTFEDFELIISDNQSTDRTAEICLAYVKKDPRIRYYRNEENLGAARNYNRVFELSTAPYFKWLAADDICAPDFLKKCVEVLDRKPNVILAYTRAKLIDVKGEVLMDSRDQCMPSTSNPCQRFHRLLYGIHECIPIFGLIRSSALRKTNLIGSFIASDQVLILQLGLIGQLYEVGEYLFYFRIHQKASTRVYRDPNGQQDQDALTAWYDPKTTGKIILPWWKRIYEIAKVVLSAPLNVLIKGKLFLSVMRYIIWKRDVLTEEFLIASKKYLKRLSILLRKITVHKFENS